MWKEDYCNTDMMSMNIDMGWCMSLGSDWELFGGEIKLGGLGYQCDSVAVHADSSGEVGWKTVEDDAVSVCSSATSWSCLHSNSLLETYSEMYSNLCKPEDDDEFDRMLPNELIDDIASCVNSGLSLEQFCEINGLIEVDADVDCSDSAADLLSSMDVINSEVVDVDLCKAKGPDSCHSDESVISRMPKHMDTVRFSVNNIDHGMDASSPDSAVASLECEELYEESVGAEDVLSTISCEELEELMTSSCDQSVVEVELLEDVETSPMSRRRPYAELTNSRRLRKKEQNKSAALRYRLKKRSEQGLVLSEYAMLERRNIELRTRIDEMTKEISYLKSLIDELCP